MACYASHFLAGTGSAIALYPSFKKHTEMNLLELFAMLLHMRCSPKRRQKIKPEENTVLIAVQGVKLRKPGYLFIVFEN